MSSSMKDKVKGAFHTAKGKAKEVAGRATDDQRLEAKGTIEKTMGKAQTAIGRAKKALGK